MQTPSVTDVSAQTGESWGSENDGGSIVWANAVPLPTAAAATQNAIPDANRSNDLTGRALTVSARPGTGAAVMRDAIPLAGRIGIAEAVLDRSLAGQERSGSRNTGAGIACTRQPLLTLRRGRSERPLDASGRHHRSTEALPRQRDDGQEIDVRGREGIELDAGREVDDIAPRDHALDARRRCRVVHTAGHGAVRGHVPGRDGEVIVVEPRAAEDVDEKGQLIEGLDRGADCVPRARGLGVLGVELHPEVHVEVVAPEGARRDEGRGDGEVA